MHDEGCGAAGRGMDRDDHPPRLRVEQESGVIEDDILRLSWVKNLTPLRVRRRRGRMWFEKVNL